MSISFANELQTTSYLDFLQSIDLPSKINKITKIDNAPTYISMSGWQPIISFTCLDDSNRVIEIDFRHGWGTEIWQQNLFDLAWDETRLLTKRQINSDKIIVYLCEAETGLSVKSKLEFVPSEYIIYPNWETVRHLYLSLPLAHPFRELEIPKNYLRGYSTTRKLSSKKPDFKTINSSQLAIELNLTSNKIEGGLRTQGLYKEDTKDRPLISVITVVFNGEKYLEQTIQSVINQSYDNLEYIIVDGGSTDKTLEIIQQYNELIDYWISASDRGIYDAMNKATTLALGRHTLHINADDLLFQANSLDLAYSDATIAGSVLIFHPEERVFKKRLNKNIDRNQCINAIRYPFHHQGFIGLRNQNSLFDLNYKIIADNLLMAKKISQEKIITLDSIIALHRREGVSAENNDAINRELQKAIALFVKDCNMTPKEIIRVYWTIYKKIIYSKLRSIAKVLNLVTLKRKYF